MFTDQPSSGELRQGDICFEWPFPFWNLNSYQVSKQVTTGSLNSAVVNLLASGDSLPVAICSHDCEVENPRGRTGLSLAPLLPWPYSDLGSDESLELIQSHVPGELQIDNRTVADAGVQARADSESPRAYGFINLFPVNLGSTETNGWRYIDFSAITAIGPPRKIKGQLLKGKRFEMEDETRDRFKAKLAAFFSR